MTVRAAQVGDAAAIAAVHVAAWRSAYAGLLPSAYLAGLSVIRNAAQFHAGIRAGRPVLVAEAEGRVVGYASLGRARTPGLADGEIETLYVLDDWRDQGHGRDLMQAAAAHMAGTGCASAFVWVLQENPSRWFYERLGGRSVARSVTHVAGRAFDQVAYQWEPIGKLLRATAES